jgi:3-hydroxy-9,10-secoandrosta-1,3,5(10)-triene-9,17-dione monooxygenase
MSSNTTAPGHDLTVPPEPGLTPAEVIARAEAIAVTLVARQAETEKRTYYAPDTHQEFVKAGFYRILVPRRYGGYEFGIDTFLRVAIALARGCPSTGWMYALGAAHALIAASLFGEQAQGEIFRGGDFICPATVAPGGKAVAEAGGQWTISGTWNYCSGAPYATHFIGHTLVSAADGQDPEPMLFIVPRSDWELVDDWGQLLGLKGSGSHSITIPGAHVPGYLALPSVHLANISVSGGTPGQALHGNPEYAGGTLGFMFLELAALAVGMAKGALDAYDELLRSKTTFFPPIVIRSENTDYQLWHGDAIGKIATAEAALFNAVQQWRESCRKDTGNFTRYEDLHITAICGEVIRLCWQAVERHLFRTAGSSSIRQGERIERAWRDLSMVHSHAGNAIFLTTAASRALSQFRLGAAEAEFATR